MHSAVPHRYLLAYLVAIKSFLHHQPDITVFVHDDGSLTEEDKVLIRSHIDGVHIIDRAVADRRFNDQINDPFLAKVRSSYTSYLKLFDPTLVSDKRRIIIVDTDTLFLKRPSVVIEWAAKGGLPWYHRVPQGKMKISENAASQLTQLQDVHIQTLITRDLDDINEKLNRQLPVHARVQLGIYWLRQRHRQFLGTRRAVPASLRALWRSHFPMGRRANYSWLGPGLKGCASAAGRRLLCLHAAERRFGAPKQRSFTSSERTAFTVCNTRGSPIASFANCVNSYGHRPTF